MRFETISEEQIFLLASILHQPPSETNVAHAERICCVGRQLNRDLLRPDFLHRFVQLPQSHYTSLCGLHKILNAKVVHQIFILLATEVGIRLNSLVVAGRDKLGHETWDSSILNLRSLHGAWLHPKVFRDTFGRTLDIPESGYCNDDYMTKWLLDDRKCEACILAKISGDLDTVLDLQMIVKSRTHTRSVRKFRAPRLSKVVDGWLEMWKHHYQTGAWHQKLEWNRLRAERIKQVRRDVAKEKKHARQDDVSKMTAKKRGKSPRRSARTAEHVEQGARNVERFARPATSQNNSEETIRVYLSPETSDSDAEREFPTSDNEEDDNKVRRTINDAENEIIDCYAALISTPFLPGMGAEEHLKRSSRLSRHGATLINKDEGTSWPMVADSRVKQPLSRSQSTKSKRATNYSDSVYSQNFDTLPAATFLQPKDHKELVKGLRRSYTVQDKRMSDRSWITASVAPSAAATQVSVSDANMHNSRKHHTRIDTAIDGSLAPRYMSSKFRTNPVSPIQENEHHQSDQARTELVRNSESSPVSPLSPTFPPPPPLTTTAAAQACHPDHISQNFTRPLSRAQSTGHSRFHEHISESTRLKSSNEAAADPDSVLDSVRQLRQRDTLASDTTHWSALYGSDADRIKRLEAQFQGSNTRSGPRSHKSGERR